MRLAGADSGQTVEFRHEGTRFCVVEGTPAVGFGTRAHGFAWPKALRLWVSPPGYTDLRGLRHSGCGFRHEGTRVCVVQSIPAVGMP